jgi:hypothetical protein
MGIRNYWAKRLAFVNPGPIGHFWDIRSIVENTQAVHCENEEMSETQILYLLKAGPPNDGSFLTFIKRHHTKRTQ